MKQAITPAIKRFIDEAKKAEEKLLDEYLITGDESKLNESKTFSKFVKFFEDQKNKLETK